MGNHEVEKIVHPNGFDYSASTTGVLAGTVLACRRRTIGGALVALEVIHDEVSQSPYSAQ